MHLHFSTVRAAWIQFVAWLIVQPARRVFEPVPGLPDPSAVAPQPPPARIPLERPSLSQLALWDEAKLPPFVRHCAVARKYLRLLGPLDWEHFPERDPHRPWPGPQPQPRAAYVAAFLVKLEEGKRYMSDLREFLVEHPALVWVLGFPLVPSDQFACGFDVKASLSCARHAGLGHRHLDAAPGVGAFGGCGRDPGGLQRGGCSADQRVPDHLAYR